ncbi:MAG: helix-turn-helix domain-containing protein [Chloroflexi bacterium]|nr:helix-turn-helix domain-containing protein [Chloroflexota bacterium]
MTNHERAPLTEFLTVDAVAELCHRHPVSIRRWIRAGLLPAVKPDNKPGGRFLIRREDLDALLTPTTGARA